MKVTLILTPTRPGERRKFTAPPLGILCLGSYLKEIGHDVTLIDADVEGYTLENLAKKIVSENADLIGITVMTSFAANVLNICKKIKKMNPDSKIVLGGVHVTASGSEMMEYSPYVDYLVVGEGEYTTMELLNALANKSDLKNIRGLIYRDTNGQIIKNEPRPPIPDIDSLPMPMLDLIENLNFKNYNAIHAGGKKIVNILGSRGCPFNCTFCGAYLVHGRRVRYRSPKKIVDEIEYNQKKFGIDYVAFKDSTFTLNHQWVKEICDEIIKRGLKMGFCVNARVDTVNEEILKILKKAGCETIGFGIESGSQRILDKLKKGTTLEQIKKAVDLVSEMDFFTTSSFMFGNPSETKEDVKKTYELAKSSKLMTVGFCPLTAFPGTEIYVDALKDGTLKNSKWYLKRNPDPYAEDEFLPVGYYDGVLTFTDFSTEEEMKKAYYKFYFRPGYIFFIFKKLIKNPHYLKYALDYAWGMLKETFDQT